MMHHLHLFDLYYSIQYGSFAAHTQ